MISVSLLCRLLGIVLLICAARTMRAEGRPHRHASAAFWGCYGLIFLCGEEMPALWVGVAVVGMAIMAGLGGVLRGEHEIPDKSVRTATAQRLGVRLYVPALMIPILTVAISLALKGISVGGRQILDPQNAILSSLGIATVLALAAACLITRGSVAESTREAHRLIDTFGWALVLPQLLAMLGLLFMQSGVGAAVTQILGPLLAMNSKLIAVVVYCLGMMSVTMIMGNAFAVFPIMAAGIGIPVLIHQFGANPAIVAAVGMFSGYCGSLVTPMNATYNIVPVALLELNGKYAIIKVQAVTACALILFNIAFLYLMVA